MKHVVTAVMVQMGLCILILGLVLWCANFSTGAGKRFAHFGPATNAVPISVFGADISSWKRWTILILLLGALEAVTTYTHKIYKQWYRYRVQNKGASGMSHGQTMFLITCWRVTTFFPHVFKWLLVISTQQLQFLLPALVVRICVSNVIDYNILI